MPVSNSKTLVDSALLPTPTSTLQTWPQSPRVTKHKKPNNASQSATHDDGLVGRKGTRHLGNKTFEGIKETVLVWRCFWCLRFQVPFEFLHQGSFGIKRCEGGGVSCLHRKLSKFAHVLLEVSIAWRMLERMCRQQGPQRNGAWLRGQQCQGLLRTRSYDVKRINVDRYVHFNS